jgi:hypothetical protein
MQADLKTHFISADRASILLSHALAILAAIEFGELLSAMPANSEDQSRHQTAVQLLEALRELLLSEKSSTGGGINVDQSP